MKTGSPTTLHNDGVKKRSERSLEHPPDSSLQRAGDRVEALAKHQGERATKVRAGRTRLIDRRLEEVLSAAADVFVECGFDKANYNEICRRASISKASLYERFPSKEQLFLTVLDHRMQSLAQRMSMAEIEKALPVRDALRGFGEGLLSSVLCDAQVELIRTICAVTPRLPQLGERFFELGPRPASRSMNQFLRDKVKSGELRDIDPPEQMTRVFINMAIDGFLYRRLLGVAASLSERERRGQVERAVEVFMRLYAPATQESSLR